MNDKPSLRAKIEQARYVFNGTAMFKTEHERVAAVITKLAKGHALYELHEACTRSPDEINIIPLALMDEAQYEIFEHPKTSNIWPEVGSRAMQRLFEGIDLTGDGWIIVQPERYRYHASVGDSVNVRIVIHEYLAGYVQWGY